MHIGQAQAVAARRAHAVVHPAPARRCRTRRQRGPKISLRSDGSGYSPARPAGAFPPLLPWMRNRAAARPVRLAARLTTAPRAPSACGGHVSGVASECAHAMAGPDPTCSIHWRGSRLRQLDTSCRTACVIEAVGAGSSSQICGFHERRDGRASALQRGSPFDRKLSATMMSAAVPVTAAQRPRSGQPVRGHGWCCHRRL